MTNAAAGNHSRTEILSQAESWRSAVHTLHTAHARVANLFAWHHHRPVLFVACGSPYYLGLTAAAICRSLGKLASAAPASDVLLNAPSVLPPGPAPLAIAVSRSGETSELLAACRKLKAAGSPLLVITVAAQSSLHSLADAVVSIPKATERSMAQTRSFSAMLIETLGAVAIGARRPELADELSALPAQAQILIRRAYAPIRDLLARGYRQVYVLGSGARYGLANEGALKMKEMSLTGAEPFHFLEFRHGPQSMVDQGTLVIGLVSDAACDLEMQVLREMRALGGAVLAITPRPAGGDDASFVEIPIAPGLSEVAGLPCYMPPLQLAAYHQAMRRGVDCDAPRNLKHFIELTGLG
jgi:glucosamine--fructose-6-phosphate aminotransferase (isomerizing)